MKWFLKRLLLLFIVFAASLAVFSLIINRKHNFTDTEGRQAVSLPILYVLNGSTEYNPMYGYRDKPNLTNFRETVTCVSADRNLNVRLYNCGMSVKSITYTVTSLSDSTVIEEGRVKHLAGDGNVTEGDLHLEEPIAMAREYSLLFTVDVGEERPVYYLTRVVSRSGQNLAWYLDYTADFCSRCLTKDLTDEMKNQLEPTNAGITSSFHKVDIHSQEDKITWGDLAPSFAVSPTTRLLEINETTVSLGLEYIISYTGNSGAEEFCYVSEFYRMRKAQDHVILLDFERTCDSFFDGNLPVLTEEGIDLGIAGRDTPYRSDADGNITAFVRNRELWVYDRPANKVSCAFSFREEKGKMDLRALRGTMDIRVSNVSADGNTDFIVYGYMPSGAHEGLSGVSVYRYDAADNTTTEKLFIPVADSFDVQKDSMEKLSYVNTAGQLFLCIGNSLYRIDTSSFAVSVLEDKLDWDTFKVSDSGMIMSWMDDDKNIRLLNLEKGETSVITSPGDMRVRNLGFSGEDVIFGLAYFSNSYTDSAGNDVFLMSKIDIADFTGEVRMEYYRNGIYVTDIVRSEDVLLLSRVVRSELGITRISDDQVLYYAPSATNNVTVDLVVDERKGTEVVLCCPGSGKTSNLLELHARYTVNDSIPEVRIDEQYTEEEQYFVYAKGGLMAVTGHLNEAVGLADENVGVVLNSAQQYVWERGNVKAFIKLDPSQIPQELLTADATESSVAQAVGNGYNIWNLSGCSLSSIRYQLSGGYPVAARWGVGETILILGYDQYNIWIYNPAEGGLSAIAFEDAEPRLEQMGNVFISYHTK